MLEKNFQAPLHVLVNGGSFTGEVETEALVCVCGGCVISGGAFGLEARAQQGESRGYRSGSEQFKATTKTQYVCSSISPKPHFSRPLFFQLHLSTEVFSGTSPSVNWDNTKEFGRK